MGAIQDVQAYVSTNTSRLARNAEPALREQFAAVVDVGFFLVGVRKEADAAELQRLTGAAHEGFYDTLNPFDSERDYVALGAWIGDQGLAMHFMAMAEKLELGEVVTPERLKAALSGGEVEAPAGGIPLYLSFVPRR